jgi:hypothetical protein
MQIAGPSLSAVNTKLRCAADYSFPKRRLKKFWSIFPPKDKEEKVITFPAA